MPYLLYGRAGKHHQQDGVTSRYDDQCRLRRQYAGGDDAIALAATDDRGQPDDRSAIEIQIELPKIALAETGTPVKPNARAVRIGRHCLGTGFEEFQNRPNGIEIPINFCLTELLVEAIN